MLIICPEGGLANRLRVLASVLQLRNEYQCSLTCYWALRVGELLAPFERLFEPISDLLIREPPSYLDSLKPVLSRYLWRRLWCHSFNRVFGVARYLYEDSSHPGAIAKALPAARHLLARPSGAPVLIRTWQSFGAYRHSLKLFLPIAELQRRIDSLVLASESPIIGIHVRRTDHSTAIRLSPLEGFFYAADAALEQHYGAQLFLCTDDASVRSAFRHRYGTRVLVSNAQLSRSSTEAIQDAVVDLFSLARCTRIIGSYHSSFSELAAMIGDRPLHTVGLDAL